MSVFLIGSCTLGHPKLKNSYQRISIQMQTTLFHSSQYVSLSKFPLQYWTAAIWAFQQAIQNHSWASLSALGSQPRAGSMCSSWIIGGMVVHSRVEVLTLCQGSKGLACEEHFCEFQFKMRECYSTLSRVQPYVYLVSLFFCSSPHLYLSVTAFPVTRTT